MSDRYLIDVDPMVFAIWGHGEFRSAVEHTIFGPAKPFVIALLFMVLQIIRLNFRRMPGVKVALTVYRSAFDYRSYKVIEYCYFYHC